MWKGKKMPKWNRIYEYNYTKAYVPAVPECAFCLLEVLLSFFPLRLFLVLGINLDPTFVLRISKCRIDTHLRQCTTTTTIHPTGSVHPAVDRGSPKPWRDQPTPTSTKHEAATKPVHTIITYTIKNNKTSINIQPEKKIAKTHQAQAYYPKTHN